MATIVVANVFCKIHGKLVTACTLRAKTLVNCIVGDVIINCTVTNLNFSLLEYFERAGEGAHILETLTQK